VGVRSFISFLAVLAVVGLLAFGLLSKGDAKIAKHRGEWVLVNLWASWCLPCREEAPVLERFYRRYRAHGVVVVGIDVQDNRDDAVAFLRDHPAGYPQLRSIGNERSAAFGSIGVPENFLVNPRGRLALIWRRPVDDRILREQVAPLIEGRQ
jgi:cytochrome c biogenesis protein CcmG, thiol:disulfide interchange protein DsbE